ncbi:MAG: flotillin family protein [Bacteroidota bacterium]
MLENVSLVVIGGIVLFIVGFVVLLTMLYKKVPQGKALVITGFRGIRVSFGGTIVIPVFEKMELMDISVKKVEISRRGKDGLVCKDNMRADIQVAFFVRVNPQLEDVRLVAQSIGCERASTIETLNTLFESKFSEALKTVGKRFDFVELYDSRDMFKQEVKTLVEKSLNGYKLDDCAIDYLEQTSVEFLRADNILDSEGIKKITELTAAQNVLSNQIRREEEKTITEQDVIAKEAILELNRQLAEKEERQKREVANIKAREEAEIAKVQEEERLKSERARIASDEEIGIAEANKERQVIVAMKNKERTEAIESERVEKDRALEANERERVVTLAQIEKDKALEEEKKQIQDIIKERVAVDKKVAEEEEKIKDLRAIAEAERLKQVAIKEAEQEGESIVIHTTKKAEADKLAAEVNAQTILIDANAKQEAALKEAEARKTHAEAKAAEEATIGLAEAQVIEAKAAAKERDGSVEAIVLEKKMLAEAKGIEAKAESERKRGMAEADVLQETGSIEAKIMEEKAFAEAKGVAEKAKAMHELNEAGKAHEEFKLRLEKEKEVEMAHINVQAEIAKAQVSVMAEALRNAKIDIVGGEAEFFQNITRAIGQGKSIDRLIDNSSHLTDVKSALMNGNGDLIGKVKGYIEKLGLQSEDLRNISMSALLLKLYNQANDSDRRSIAGLMDTVKALGIGGQSVEKVL